MKKTIIAVGIAVASLINLLVPTISYAALGVGWTASTTNLIYPAVGSNYYSPIAPYYIASSTTHKSTFNSGIDVYSTLTSGDVGFVTTGEDPGLLSTFSGGDNPQYDVFSYVLVGDKKIYSVTPYQTGVEVSAQTYSQTFDWDTIPSADGYAIFRDRNADFVFDEVAFISGGQNSSFIDSDYTPHPQSVMWASSTEAIITLTSFLLRSSVNYSNTYGTFGFSSLAGANFATAVGIGGTTTPGNTLSVQGSSNLGNFGYAGYFIGTTTATSTLAGGLDISGGCFAINHTCLGNGGASLSGGSLNTMTYWTSASTVGATSSPTVGIIVATSTTATSTFANGINLNGGCYAFKGSCIATSSAGYAITSSSGSLNPVDATNYYWGMFDVNNAPVAFGGKNRVLIPKSGTITAIGIAARVGGTLGSNENVTYNLILNNVSTTTITTTAQMTSFFNNTNNTSLSIPVVAGDYYEIQEVSPTWATNPTVVFQNSTVYIDTGGLNVGNGVNPGTANQVAYYATTGSAVSGTSLTTLLNSTSTAVLTGQTATNNSVNTFTPTASSSYMIAANTTVTAEAVQTLTVAVTYTDTAGTTVTQNFFGMGLTTAALASTGDSNFPPMIIRPLKNTAITVKSTVAGIGSITYNIDASIIPISTQ